MIIEENEEIIVQQSLQDKIKELPMAYYLIAINLVVFVMLHLSNVMIEPYWFISKFAKDTSAIAINHEYYRFVTAIFTHESISHLAFNCMALFVLAKPVEAIFGKTKFLIIFLVSGLFGTLVSFIFSSSLAIGASGGVYGIFGVHLYLLYKNKTAYFKIFGKDMLQLLLINIFVGFVVPNIDFWGHFGGILGGFVATSTLGLTHKLTLSKTTLIGSFLTFVLFFGSFFVFSQSYLEYNLLVDELIDQANDAINNDDLERLNNITLTLEEEKPLLPPSPKGEYVIDQIRTIIDEMK